ncbi:tuftelin 1b isoform X1 [Oryzias melastigma]|uniref:tuftelin 1b isoform X1 n=1 Tax=Oryzias melastigma TaxID=30732 RepID=UPI00168CC4A7|nr:tuftelin 1b isoform X1 [Oryzias melastigma]
MRKISSGSVPQSELCISITGCSRARWGRHGSVTGAGRAGRRRPRPALKGKQPCLVTQRASGSRRLITGDSAQGPVKLRLPQQTQELPLRSSDPLRSKKQESSIAVVLPQTVQNQNGRGPAEENTEVIKVYLESRLRSPGSVRMLTDEVSQIQEVRYCLKTLREQMAARQNNNNNNNKFPANVLRLTPGDPPAAPDSLDSNVSVGDDQQESSRLREVTRRLYARLKEAESRHQEEKDRLQAESSELRDLLAERSERLQKAEQTSREKQQRVEELQTLLHSTQQESSHLKDKVAEKEAELLKLKTSEEEQRCAELEKELSVLKEKNHHLDDMLKSHQRKVRSMIEQVQNSKMLLQDRDQVIRDLEERVAFLDAENRELHDHMDFFLNGHEAPPSSDGKPDVVYSKPLTPTAHGSKPLPYIKVIEIQP